MPVNGWKLIAIVENFLEMARNRWKLLEMD